MSVAVAAAFVLVAVIARKPSVDFYWKERLEQIMDSLPVNLMVIILVMIDMVTILFFLLGTPGSAVPSEEALDDLTDEIISELEADHSGTATQATSGPSGSVSPGREPSLASTDEPTWMFALSLTVVCCLLLELTLRQIGQGRRFWKGTTPRARARAPTHPLSPPDRCVLGCLIGCI